MQVILLAAQSLDGFITRHGAPGSGFTSAEDKEHFRAALAGCDCSIMGGITYRESCAAKPSNAARHRLCVVLTRTPTRNEAEARPDLLEFTDKAPEKIITDLRARGCTRCALLGGGQIYSLFLAAKQVDELWLTVEPILFGGGARLMTAAMDARLELLSSRKLNAAGTLVLRYRILQ
ncbi:MAG: dihydrofolate reductase [Verrucomicrobiota bacterium]|nr:dihydrofolate reductase [Verrucomicrobiota bacterium]